MPLAPDLPLACLLLALVAGLSSSSSAAIATQRCCPKGAFLPSHHAQHYDRRRRLPRASCSSNLPVPRTSLITATYLTNDVEEFGCGQPRDVMWHERSKHWVVLVDDEESIRKSVGQFLFDSGYQVTACKDAETALKVCQSSRTDKDDSQPLLPDVIVSDIRMPGGKDGLELLGDIRADERLVEVPVVLLTAKGLTEDRIAGFKAGADAYLPKPFDPEELLTIIDNAIQRHQTLSGGSVEVDDLKRDLDEIKFMLLERGGGGVGGGWVEATNVFLAPDEREVLELLCKGLMNREIAEELFISTRRVEQHLTSMFRKTGTSNRTELVRWAVSTGNVEI